MQPTFKYDLAAQMAQLAEDGIIDAVYQPKPRR